MRPLFASPHYVSPYLIIDSIPELSANNIPAPLMDSLRGLSLEPWNLLEDAVSFGFRSILGRSTIVLGKEKLFQHEPEGIVLEENCHEPGAVLYECKTRAAGYKMTSDDVLRYKDYIRRKRVIVETLYKLPLRHFVIIAGSFHGNVAIRVKEIEKEGVALSLLSAHDLTYLLNSAREMTRERVALIGLRSIFSSGVVRRNQIDLELKRFATAD